VVDMPRVERVVDDAVDVSVAESHSATRPSNFERPLFRSQAQPGGLLFDLPCAVTHSPRAPRIGMVCGHAPAAVHVFQMIESEWVMK
jgi:hypothetical protein